MLQSFDNHQISIEPKNRKPLISFSLIMFEGIYTPKVFGGLIKHKGAC